MQGDIVWHVTHAIRSTDPHKHTSTLTCTHAIHARMH
jgi:hypothetical protein